MYIENEELCIKNEESCIKNEEFCIKNDEFCRQDDLSGEDPDAAAGNGASCGAIFVLKPMNLLLPMMNFALKMSDMFTADIQPNGPSVEYFRGLLEAQRVSVSTDRRLHAQAKAFPSDGVL